MDSKSVAGLADETRFELSPKLLLQAEYKYQDLLDAEEAISRACRLTKEEFMLAFKRCNIHVKIADEKALNEFFRIHSKDLHDTINFDRFFENYQLTDRLLRLQSTLEGHFSRDHETQVAANKALRADRFSFEDIVYLLKRCNFEMSVLETQRPGPRRQPSGPGLAGTPGFGPPQSKEGPRPEEFPVVYKDLFDLFQVLKGNEPEFLLKQQVMDGLKIPRLDVVHSDEEEAVGKDGKKSGKKRQADGRQETKGRTLKEK